MKIKKIGIILLESIILLFLLNEILFYQYENYVYGTYSKIVSRLVEKFPESEQEIMDTIINGEGKENSLTKYGIHEDTLENIHSFKKIKQKTILITSTIYLLIILTAVIIYLKYSLKIKKEIKKINKYLQEILKGTYDLNIADYDEDALSLLKNDIYKVTIKLKELSEYEHHEQIFLMNTLEDISHQLKTPLTALMVTNDILKNTNLTKQERMDFLNKQTKELEKMEWLITTLLKYSKLDSGSIKLKKEKVNIEEMIKSIIETLSIAIELKNITIELEELDFELICDANWTKEALTNIIKNAYEHIDIDGEITIKGENNPLYQSIIITDNGKGIAKEEISNIFKRFYTTNSTKNSIGIGLNMAKLIIEKQKGKIEVASEIGKYTTFKVIFPKKNV